MLMLVMIDNRQLRELTSPRQLKNWCERYRSSSHKKVSFSTIFFDETLSTSPSNVPSPWIPSSCVHVVDLQWILFNHLLCCRIVLFPFPFHATVSLYESISVGFLRHSPATSSQSHQFQLLLLAATSWAEPILTLHWLTIFVRYRSKVVSSVFSLQFHPLSPLIRKAYNVRDLPK